MKRWLCSLWLAVGVMFLLWMPHRCVRPQLHPQDQSVLSQKEFVSTWIRALRATNPAFIQSRAGPLEFFATEFGLSVVAITSDDGPPWLDSRGPPALRSQSRLGHWFARLLARPAAKRGGTFQYNSVPPEVNSTHEVLQHALASFCRETLIWATKIVA